MKFVMKRKCIIRRLRGNGGDHRCLPSAFDGFPNKLEDPFGVGVESYFIKPPSLRKLSDALNKSSQNITRRRPCNEGDDRGGCIDFHDGLPSLGFLNRLQDPFGVGADAYFVKPPNPLLLVDAFKKAAKNIARRGYDCGGHMDYHDVLSSSSDGFPNRLEDPFGVGVESYFIKPPKLRQLFDALKKPPQNITGRCPCDEADDRGGRMDFHDGLPSPGFLNRLKDPFGVGVDAYFTKPPSPRLLVKFDAFKKPAKNITRKPTCNRGDDFDGRMDYHDGLPSATDGFSNRLEDPFGVGVESYFIKPPSLRQLSDALKKPSQNITRRRPCNEGDDRGGCMDFHDGLPSASDGFSNRLEDAFGVGVEKYFIKPPSLRQLVKVMEEGHYEKDSPAGSESRRVAHALDNKEEIVTLDDAWKGQAEESQLYHNCWKATKDHPGNLNFTCPTMKVMHIVGPL